MVERLHAVSHWLYKRRVPVLPRAIKALLYVFYNCVLPPEVELGPGSRLWHSGLGIVVHPNTTIGRNCNIYNFVVLGGGHHGPGGPAVRIIVGDNVNIGAGAKILCSRSVLSIGANSTIGANAVVIDDVPPNVVVAGIPGRIINQKQAPDA